MYIEVDLEDWDIAAAQLIFNEAGGCCKKIDDLYIFGCKEVFDRIIDKISDFWI